MFNIIHISRATEQIHTPPRYTHIYSKMQTTTMRFGEFVRSTKRVFTVRKTTADTPSDSASKKTEKTTVKQRFASASASASASVRAASTKVVTHGTALHR